MERLADRGWLVSTSAYAGLPDAVLQRDLARLASAVERIDGTFSLQRDNYAIGSPGGTSSRWRAASGNSVAGPDGKIAAVPAGSGPVPVKLLPAPETVREAFRWPASHNTLNLSSPFEDLVVAAGRVGRSILFKTGPTSDCRATVPHPQPGIGAINARSFLVQSICDTDRAVFCGGRGDMLARTERSLNRAAPGGGHLDVRLKTVALNENVYLMQVEPPTGEPHRSLVFPIADGWPANLAYADLSSRSGPGAFAVAPGLVEPTEGGRSLLVVPRPEEKSLAQTATRDETLIEPTPFPTVPLWGSAPTGQERFALPETWADADALFTVRKAPDWAPFSETYIIEKGVDRQAATASDIRLIVLFGSATDDEIADLVRAAQHAPSGP
jgi:hypothetical protein